MEQKPQNFYEFGPFRIDSDKRLLIREQTAVPIAPKVFDTLLALVRNRERTLKKEELIKMVWPDSFVEDASLTNSISALRKILAESPADHRYIVTVPGHGYRFVAPVYVIEGKGGLPSEMEDPLETPLTAGLISTDAVSSGDARLWWRRWPVVLVAGAIAAAAALLSVSLPDARSRLLPGTAPGRIQSIAVLPLENLSGDREHDYFADGMTDALITDLGKVRSLRVISRTSAMQYKGSKKPLPQIAQELKVDVVVEGSVLWSGERVRITAQLIDAVTDKHLWAETYERDLRDILALQSAVARDITKEIRVRLMPAEQTQMARVPAINPDAYQSYLKGRYYQNQRTLEALTKSVQYFERAISLEPGYASGHAGLADSYSYLANHAFLPPHEVAPKAKAAALKAINLDDSLAEAHTALAYIKLNYDWDGAGAEREFHRAIELNLGYTRAHSLYACYLTARRRFDEALGEMRQALGPDPLSPYDNTNLAWHLLMARHYDEALKQVRATLDLDPSFARARLWLAFIYEQKHLYAKAITQFQEAAVLYRDNPEATAMLGHAYAIDGRQAKALEILHQLQELSKSRYVSAYDIAAIYTALKQNEAAFGCLEEAFRQRDGWLALWLTVDPRFDALRPDRRFQRLVSRLGIVERY